jgi:DNA-binding NarL/FixJ family response regulator
MSFPLTSTCGHAHSSAIQGEPQLGHISACPSSLSQHQESLSSTHAAPDQHRPSQKVTPVTAVYLLSDQPLVRAGLRSLFAPLADLDVVGEGGGLADSMPALRLLQHGPDVAVVKARADDEAFRWVHTIARSERAPRMVVIGTVPDRLFALRALSAGASAYLAESDRAEALVQILRTVAAGMVVLSEQAAQGLVRRLRPQLEPCRRQLVSGLTERERAVLALLACGRSNADIARELLLSQGTVKKHLSQVLQKLQLRTRLEAGLTAYQLGLGPTGPMETDDGGN